MRNIALAMSTVLTVSFATAVLTIGLATPVFAAAKARPYGECLGVATQRGFVLNPESYSDAEKFLDGCMAGTQR